MIPIAFQTLHQGRQESQQIEVSDLNLNIIFEPRTPCDGFKSGYLEAPETNSSSITYFLPQLLQRAIIAVRFQSDLNESYLQDAERAFDDGELCLAISWTNSRLLSFDDFCLWLSGGDVEMPGEFWLDEVPDVSLVRKVQ
jgi:hypothetical protein